MAILTVQTIDRAGDGITPTYAAAAGGGDSFANTGREFVHIKNASGGNITVTAATPQTVAGLAIADEPYVVPLTTGDKMLGPFPPGTFNDANGRVALTYSGVSSLTVGVFKVG